MAFPFQPLECDDEPPAPLLVVADLRAAGLTTSEIRTRLDGATRVRRGVFAESVPSQQVNDHLLRAQAVLAAHGDGTALANVSAAAWYGLPLWRADLADVHVFGSTHGKRRRGVKYRSYPVPPSVRSHRGVLLTDPAQTVFDCARTCKLDTAVVLGDAALHAGAVTAQDLAAIADRYPRVKGRAAAARALASLDPASGSPGESRCRLMLRRLGYRVQSQYAVLLADGRTVRADFRINGTRVLVEFDGRSKYVGSDVLWHEKTRADGLVDLGWQVVRITWDDLDFPGQVDAKIRRALARAS